MHNERKTITVYIKVKEYEADAKSCFQLFSLITEQRQPVQFGVTYKCLNILDNT